MFFQVDWKITPSSTAGLPNTCESLDWDGTKYHTQEEDITTIKEIADLLAVGRSVIKDTINLKKERLPLYRDIDEIELMIVSCTEVVDEILLQLSAVVGEDVEALKWSFNENLKPGDILLDDKSSSLDQRFLTAASTFFSMKDIKKTDLLNQINKQFGKTEPSNDDEAREVVIRKFDKLQAIMKTVLDNIDCLVLRVVDIIENAKKSLDSLNSTKDYSLVENYYVDVKNGQVLCDTLKIPNN